MRVKKKVCDTIAGYNRRRKPDVVWGTEVENHQERPS